MKRLVGILLFVLSFLWFFFPGEYTLIANRDQSLFFLTPEHLGSFLDQPGGLLEYVGSFLSQFLRFRFTGALLLAGIATAGYYLAGVLILRVSGTRDPVIGVLAAILFIGMHNYYPHQVSHSLGFLLLMGLLVLLPQEQLRKRIYLALIIPLLYLFGGGYVWIFGGLVLVEELMRLRKMDVIAILLSTAYPAMVIYGAAKLIYLDPLKQLMVIKLPFGQQYGTSLWPCLFMGWIILSLVLSGLKDPLRDFKPLWKTASRLVFCLAALVLVVHFSFNRRNMEFFHIEKLAIQKDWEGLLSYTEQHPSLNLFGSFYTNMALVNTGRLCTDLFRYPQVFGSRALCFEWDASGEVLRRGSDFFWTIHFVNEAHHWAYESMIVDGFTRRNLLRLIQSELVRGNYKIAEKYIDHLGSALFHRRLAAHYRQFLTDRQAMVYDPELGPWLGSRMEHDFFAEGSDLEQNLRRILQNIPSNRTAYEYLMAILLLEKEVDELVALLPGYLEANQGNIPVLLDECLLVYKITHQENEFPALQVSNSTIKRFDAYTQVLRQYRNPGDAARMLYPTYQNSFWFYLNFSSLN